MYKPKRLERILKGFSNHRRIEIMLLLQKIPELSVAQISERLRINFKTGADHIQKLAIAGIVIKRYEGNMVRHALTARGESMLEFCRILE